MQGGAHCDFSVLGLTGEPPLTCAACTLGPPVSPGFWPDPVIIEQLFWCSPSAPPAVRGAVGSLMQSRVHHRRELPCSCAVCQREGFMGGWNSSQGLSSSFGMHVPYHPSFQPSSFSCPEKIHIHTYIYPPPRSLCHLCFLLASFESNTGRGWQRRRTAWFALAAEISETL